MEVEIVMLVTKKSKGKQGPNIQFKPRIKYNINTINIVFYTWFKLYVGPLLSLLFPYDFRSLSTGTDYFLRIIQE